MKNNLSDLCDHLFVAIERLNDESVAPENLAAEIKRANAIAGVAREVISAGHLAVAASRAQAVDPAQRPRLLGLDKVVLDQGR